MGGNVVIGRSIWGCWGRYTPDSTVHMDMHMDIHVQKQYCTVPVCTLRRGSWRDANKYQLHLPILPCMLVCCDITMGIGSNTDDGGRTLVSRRPPTSNSVLLAGKYFVSKTAAN